MDFEYLVKDNANYAFASGEIRSLEKKLVPYQTIERMVSMEVDDILKTLEDYGYSFESLSSDDIENGLEQRRKAVLLFFQERMHNPYILRFFEVYMDFHNVKVIKKGIVSGFEDYKTLLFNGNVPSEDIELSIRTGKIDHLPDYLQVLFPQLFENFTEINDIFDMENFVDKQYFIVSQSFIKKSKNRWMKEYLKVYIDFANIKNYIRYGKIYGNFKGFENIFIKGGNLHIDMFPQDKERINPSDYGEYASLMEIGIKILNDDLRFGMIEKEITKYINEILSSTKYDIGSEELVVTFYLRQIEEIKKVSLILFGKIGGMSEDEIREYM